MKKDKISKNDELRDEYKQSDFLAPLVRGKYANRLCESSNVIVLKPKVAEAFPNEEAVNSALLSIIKLAQTTTLSCFILDQHGNHLDLSRDVFDTMQFI